MRTSAVCHAVDSDTEGMPTRVTTVGSECCPAPPRSSTGSGTGPGDRAGWITGTAQYSPTDPFPKGCLL